MKRFLGYYSSILSVLAMVAAGGVLWMTVYLEKRATWSDEAAPVAWSAAAKRNDMLKIAGHDISYWGDPQAKYSKYATRKRRKPVAIVVHFTRVKPVKRLVAYGHVSDAKRGGASFGYHFYVGRDGHIVQGAPLSRRTNHIKFKTNAQRREMAKHLWSGNTIGVSLVGGCDPLLRPTWRQWRRCSEEFVTQPQLEAGLAVVRGLQDKFGIVCDEVYGHGDLQFDRESFEGYRLSRLARRDCELPAAENTHVPPIPVAATPAPPQGPANRAARARDNGRAREAAVTDSQPNGG